MRLQHRKYAALALLLVAAGTVQGCASNPFKTAQTPEQRIFAVHGAWTAGLQQAAAYVTSENPDPQVKAIIKKIEAESAEADKAFQQAVIDYKDGKVGFDWLAAKLKAMNPFIQQMPGRFIKDSIKIDAADLAAQGA